MTTVSPNDLPIIYSRDQHPISRRQIHRHALTVLYTLHDAGFRACLVGGGVRDLLLGKSPKDFDIATDAHPEQIKKLFRNCRLIGKRFRLAHILFGRDIIEVATFRGMAHDEDHNLQTSDSGFLKRDNVYGSIDEDALRRDFSINALYYDIANFSLIDYWHGLEDLQSGVIRIIGDPQQRYREDPVRMLRALRFAARFGFTIESQTQAAILECNYLLQAVSSARLFDEVIKLLLNGNAAKTYALLQSHHIFGQLFPLTNAAFLQVGHSCPVLEQALNNTDERLSQGLSVSPFFIYAVLLWLPYQQEWQALMDDQYPPMQAAIVAAKKILSAQQSYTQIPKRVSEPLEDTWFLQLRLVRKNPKTAQKILAHPRFRAAFDFLCLRQQAQPQAELQDSIDWWQALMDEHPDWVPASRSRQIELSQ